MSRASIREAILFLKIDGLADTDETGKIIVASVGLEDVVDILRVRRALESEAIEIIASNGWLSEEKERTLQEIQNKMAENVRNKNFREQSVYDDLFHKTFVEASESYRIVELLDRMRLQMQRARWLNVVLPHRQDETIVEHEDFLKAFLQHDKEKSIALLRNHLDHSMEAFGNIMKNPDMREFILMIRNFSHQEV